MLRLTIVVFACLAYAYVYSKPTVHHRVKRWEDFPNLTFTFDCSDKAVGFYADTEHHCQIFHMCDEDGRRIPYICANDTSFNQQYRVCDWDYNFDCADAQNWYYLNELTYVTDPPKPKSPGRPFEDQ
ncbi:U-scoloptoxin(01)-Er1a [Nilaparvata lugens]|uniref:Cuticular protein n=1 Tax=Nilaparvata lugens TaxID=108931 RepID=A0A2S1ZS22_NILLU|nr:U-scoloptoxin(01)-Er1a [Nilaparvata lugens]AWK28259.1 cuticular protein [Nilaparvata lugens]